MSCLALSVAKHTQMVKHTERIRRQNADELLNVFDHFVGWHLKG